MKKRLTLANALSLIPLVFLTFCAFLLGCGGSGGSSSSSSDTDDTTTTVKITRNVRVVIDNQSGEAIKALLVFTDESFANLDFLSEDLSAGVQEIQLLQITSKELYLRQQDITITPQVPPTDEPNKELVSIVFVNEAPLDGSDIEYRVLIP
jgi:hypothetical protein